jgi:hypothetical protein
MTNGPPALEGKGDTFLRNVGNYLPCEAESHPGIPDPMLFIQHPVCNARGVFGISKL